MRHALEAGIRRLSCYGDSNVIVILSKLVISTMNNKMQLRNSELLDIHSVAKRYQGFFERIVFEHIPREQNQIADALSKKGSE